MKLILREEVEHLNNIFKNVFKNYHACLLGGSSHQSRHEAMQSLMVGLHAEYV